MLPELMAGLFGRIRAELSDGTLGDLRMSHVRVLAAIPPEGINVTELARRAGMTKQGCGQFVTYLSGTGHLSTAPDPDDGRVRLVLPEHRRATGPCTACTPPSSGSRASSPPRWARAGSPRSRR